MFDLDTVDRGVYNLKNTGGEACRSAGMHAVRFRAAVRAAESGEWRVESGAARCIGYC